MNRVVQSAGEFGSSIAGGNLFSTLFFWGCLLLFAFVAFVSVAVGAYLLYQHFRNKAVVKVATGVANGVGTLLGDAISGISSGIPSVTETLQKSPSEEAVAYKNAMLDATDTLPGDVARKVMREKETDVDALRETVKLQAAALASKGVQVTA